MSHPGLAYSHPSYAHSQLAQHPARTLQSHGSVLSQSLTQLQPHTMASRSQPSLVRNSGSSAPSNVTHHSNRGSVTSTPMYTTPTCINPYMSIPLSPSSLPNPVILAPSQHHAVTYIHPHLHGTPFIAPPPGFNVGSSAPSTCALPTTLDAASKLSTPLTPEACYQPQHSTYTSAALVPYASPVPEVMTPVYPGVDVSLSTYRYPQDMGPPMSLAYGGNYLQNSRINTAVLLKTLHEKHLSYLNTDDSPDKLELRQQLDELLEQLLAITPFEHKWKFSAVKDVLMRSVLRLPYFNGFKAAAAFEALATYASNLIVHPWRKEYRSIKLYSGFWVHTVAEHLYKPEELLQLMGYLPQQLKMTDSRHPASSYALPGSIIDADIVSGLALDFLKAQCECEVLARLMKAFPQLSAEHLLKYRQEHVGSYQEAADHLNCYLKLLSASISGTSSCPNLDGSRRPEASQKEQRISQHKTDDDLNHLDSNNYNLSKLVEFERGISRKSEGTSTSLLITSHSMGGHQSRLADGGEDSSEAPVSQRPRSSLPTTPTSSAMVRHCGSKEDVLAIPSVKNSTSKSDLFVQSDLLSLHPSKKQSCSSGGNQHCMSSKPNKVLLEDLTKVSKEAYKEKQKMRSSVEKHQLDLMQEQLDCFIGDTALKLPHSDKFCKLHKTETSSYRPSESDRKQLLSSGNNKSANINSSSHKYKGSSNLPKTLSQLRLHASPSPPASDPASVCLLPPTFPREVFLDNTQEEHIKESCSGLLSSDSRQHSLRGVDSDAVVRGQSFNDTWGFVMKDLEKKGYSKDVGNRGDILNHLTNSRSNDTTKVTILTNVAPNMASGSALAVNSHVNSAAAPHQFSAEESDMFMPICLNGLQKELDGGCSTSTIINPVDAGTARHRVLVIRDELPETLRQLDIQDARAVKYASKHSDSEYGANCLRGIERQRNSLYDNVSCEGFETARQDTDEEDFSGAEERRAVPHTGGSSATDCVDSVNFRREKSNSVTSLDDDSHKVIGIKGGVFYSDFSNGSSGSNNTTTKYLNAKSDINPVHDSSHSGSSKSSSVSARRRPQFSGIANKLTSLEFPGLHSSSKDSAENKAKNETPMNPKNNSSKGESDDCRHEGMPWPCSSCTFINETNAKVCEMCSRSRHSTSIKPLSTGGRQCNQCTLINEKDAVTCSACNITLESCPTYI